jgi:hypothetical protein
MTSSNLDQKALHQLTSPSLAPLTPPLPTQDAVQRVLAATPLEPTNNRRVSTFLGITTTQTLVRQKLQPSPCPETLMIAMEFGVTPQTRLTPPALLD